MLGIHPCGVKPHQRDPAEQPGGRSCFFPKASGIPCLISGRSPAPGWAPSLPQRCGAAGFALLILRPQPRGPAGAASGPFPHRHFPVPQHRILLDPPGSSRSIPPLHSRQGFPGICAAPLQGGSPQTPVPSRGFLHPGRIPIPGVSSLQDRPRAGISFIRGPSPSQEHPIPATSPSQERLHPWSILIQ